MAKQEPVDDAVPATVVISNPVDCSTVSRTVRINIFAADDVSVAGLKYIDDTLRSTSNSNTLNFHWNTCKVNSGTHT